MTLSSILSRFESKPIDRYHTGHESYYSNPYADPGHSTYENDIPYKYGHGSEIGSKKGRGGGHHGHKSSSAAMSALTLLAFLFFLNILQQCLKEHMMSMSTPQIMLMTREAEEKHAATKVKLDKSGLADDVRPKGGTTVAENMDGDKFLKVPLKGVVYTSTPNPVKSEQSDEFGFPGFVSAMVKK